MIGPKRNWSRGRRASKPLLLALLAIHPLGDGGFAAEFPVLAPVHDCMQAFVDDKQIAGAVTVVVRGEKIVHLEAVGFANAQTQSPLTTDAVFSIASMTKPVAAVAALILCDEGKLTLDEPIAKHLPEFSRGPSAKITLRHLLTHTSGLSGNQQNVGTLAETVQAIAKRPLLFEPGADWVYSPGISVAGRLVEVVSGQPFEIFLAERILQPLGMHETTFTLSAEQEARLAQLHKQTGKSLEVTDNWFLGGPDKRTPNPSGGLFSTAADMVRFWQMLLNGGEWDGVRILREETVREMISPQVGDIKTGFVPGMTWGLGVGVVKEPQGVTATLSPGTFGHGGVYGTQVWADPKTRTIYLLLIQQVGLANSDASKFRRAFQEAAR